MGGDLFALVHRDGTTTALNASGRAGSGADPDGLRRDGHTEMPLHHDIRTVTVPGCVDGWIALHDRFGTMPLADLLAPATRLAQSGFPASPLLAGSLRRLDDRGAEQLASLAAGSNVGVRVVRPGVAAALRDRRRRASCVLRGRVRSGPDRSRQRSVHTRRPGAIAGRLGRAADDERVRSQPAHDPAQLAGLPGAGRAPARRKGRPPGRSGRSRVGPCLDRVRHGRRLRPSDRPPRPCRRPRLARHRLACRHGRPPQVIAAARPRRPGRHHVPVHRRRRRHGRVGHPVERRASVPGSPSRTPASTSTTAASASRRGRTPGRVRSWPAPAAHAGAGAGVAAGDLVSVFGTMGGDAQPQILLQIMALLPPRRKPESGDRRRTLGAERPVDRLRHMDLRRRADRRGRGPRPGAVAGRSRPTRTHRRARPRLRQRIRPRPRDRRRGGRRAGRDGRSAQSSAGVPRSIAVVSPSAPVGRRASGRAGRRRL